MLNEVLSNYSAENKILIRNIENVRKKINNCEHAVMFNSTCIQENLLPSYTNIRLHDQAVQQRCFTKEFRVQLVREQLTEKQKKTEKLKQ